MKKHSIRCAVALLLMLSLYNVKAAAQFYTVGLVSQAADTLSLSADPYTNGFPLFPDAKIGTEKPSTKSVQEKSKKSGEKSFPAPRKKVAKTVGIPIFDATDSLVLELVKKRLTVCMPLDLMKVNSPYGYRRDPFTKCRKFHDGIDLNGVHELVFSMLPGKVHKVSYGKTGYGNYVVLDHGNIRCLYGHLSEIYTKEGNMVDAGTAVGRVGRSGRSTSEHLHCRIQLYKDGQYKSVDPQKLIAMLNGYINEYNEKLDILLGRANTKDSAVPELTISNLYDELVRQGVKHPKIVLAQAILESGHFRSKLTRTHNNILGIRKCNGEYQAFADWTECVSAYKSLVQYKFREGRETYLSFLKRIKYASDGSYIYKVREIAERL